MSIQLIIFLLYAFVFIFGACIASFMNVVIYRMPLGISVAKGRSYCPKCHKKIAFYDNIPIISYLWLGGKCRKCKEPISPRYVCIEVAGGLLALLMVWRYDFDIAALLAFAIAMVLMAICFTDWEHMVIPNGLIVVLALLAIASVFVFRDVSIPERIIGMVCIALPMYILNAWLGAFGMGDIKLMLAAGFMLGWQSTLVAAFLGIFGGGMLGIFLMLKKSERKVIAFGPYLCIGVLIALLFGEPIIVFYLGLFGLS